MGQQKWTLCRRGLHDLTDPANRYSKRGGCRPCKLAINRDYNAERGCSDFLKTEVERVLNGTPKTPGQIRQALLNDYGSISERRVYAALKRLLREGRATKVGTNAAGHVIPGVGGYLKKDP